MTYPAQNESIKTFYDSAGNPVTTKSVTENISGPGQIVYNADGSQTITFLGNSGVLVVENGTPVFVLTSGRVVTIAASPTSLGTLV